MWALPSHLWDCPSLSPPLLLPQLLGRGRPRGAQGRGRLKRRSGASPRAAEPAGSSSSCECLRRGLRANKAAGWGGAGQRPKKCGRAGCSCAVWRADYSMASPKRFPTLVQLEQREGTLFEVLGNLTKRPYWFHSEYLKSPKAVHLEAWLVEAIFGRGGEHIPHVECVSQTLLHVHQWDPDGEAEILIFGRPYYQQDVSKMIMNLADYHRQLRARSSEKAPAREAATQWSPDAVQEAGTQRSPDAVQEAGTQRSPDAVQEAGTQRSPDAVQEAGTQRSPSANQQAAIQLSSGKVRETGTQRSPSAIQQAATQSSPEKVQETGTQRSPGAAREAATQRSPGAAREAATQRSPGAAREAGTQSFLEVTQDPDTSF
uniref:KH domain containing 3 like, subcortical maternal complex member n=1 Tax=Bos taurus TaxID=9913 RepID=E1BPE9_BOVIN